MRVLCLTSGLPSEVNPQAGIFVKEQVDSLRQLGVQVETLDVAGKGRPLNYVKAAARLFRLVREKKFDLVHAHYGLCVLVAHAQCRAPVVACFHGGDVLEDPSQTRLRTVLDKLLIGLNRLFMRHARAIIVQSREMKDALGLPHARIVPFGVNLALFHPLDRMQACLRLGLDAARRRMLFANNPAIPLKQFQLAERVFDLVRKTCPETDLVVLGKEPRERVPLFMNACDVLILTSLTEGSPNVVKEAMACNLPIVSTDVGDVREVIGATPSCFVVSGGADEMAARIIGIFSSGQRSNGFAAIQSLSAEAVARRTLEVYRAAIGRDDAQPERNRTGEHVQSPRFSVGQPDVCQP